MPAIGPTKIWGKLFRAVRKDPQKAGFLTVLAQEFGHDTTQAIPRLTPPPSSAKILTE